MIGETQTELTQAFNTLEALEALGNARNDKLALLKANKDNEILHEMVKMAYAFGRNYYITPDNTTSFQTSPNDPVLLDNWKQLQTLLDKFLKSKITGNSARDAWNAFLNNCSPLEQKWYSRILGHDLRIGIARFEKIWLDMAVKFGCKCALEYDPEKMELEFPIIVEPKCDGMRFIHHNGETTQRSGQSYTPLFGFASRMWADTSDRFADSEFLADFNKENPDDKKFRSYWNKSMTLATKGRPKNGWTPEAVAALDPKWLERVHTEGVFWLFDSMPNNIFQQEDKTPFLERRNGLLTDFIRLLYTQIIKRNGDKKSLDAIKDAIQKAFYNNDHRALETAEQTLNEISRGMKLPFVIMPQRFCENSEQVQEFYEQCLALGFEGVVLKKLNGTYLADSGKRNQDWLKYIPHASVDVEVIGFQEGEGKWQGMLGAFLVKMPDGTEMKCSGRLTQEQRKDVWENRKDWLGAIIQMEYRDDANPVTGESGAVRFGQFVRRRLDKEDESRKPVSSGKPVSSSDLAGK